MKSGISYTSKRKFYRPYLFLGEKKYFKSDIEFRKDGYEQRGYYQSKDCTICLSVNVGWLKDTPELIIMHCDYNGFSYQRNYNCLLSEHSLKLACAKFCKDIIENKIPTNGK